MDKPIKIYAETLEGEALAQFYSAMSQDFSVKGALMPDAHTGYSLPIGAAIATEGVILPSWVGYDIGCGMSALPLNIHRDDIDGRHQAIFDEIYKQVPVGGNRNSVDTKGSQLTLSGLSAESAQIATDKYWQLALGSLGGGNHFIEIGHDEQDQLWIVIHSGSRGVGYGIAHHYMKRAANSDKAKEGHFGFKTDSLEGQAYINDLNWGLQFALDNRKEMIRRVANIILERPRHAGLVNKDNLINRNHNHAVLRDGLWIHRKGATHAEVGMDGVIPGNMRDGSFIVEGKGNPDALYSSSHGAGRVLSRKAAREQVQVGDFEKTMVGITAKVGASTVDESPFSYKDVFEVMRLQQDLVKVKHHIKPLINIKG